MFDAYIWNTCNYCLSLFTQHREVIQQSSILAKSVDKEESTMAALGLTIN